jgi:transcriptional regulator with XRE-family HTH domain
MSQTSDNRATEARVMKRIRDAREAAGLSQTQLAAQLGVTYQQLSKYESGKNRMPIARLLMTAKALDKHVMHFLEGVTNA